MWTNDLKEQQKLTDKYVVPHICEWEKYGISPSTAYRDWRLEDGSGRLTDIMKCNSCGNMWKDYLSHYKKCPYCNGTSVCRKIDSPIKNIVKSPIDGKRLHLDESIIFNTLVSYGYLPSNNMELKYAFIPNYRHDGYHGLESDFFFPQFNVTIECQGEQHFCAIDINDDPMKTDSDRRRMLFAQVIRDVYKFNVVYNKRVLYYINTDNVLCDENDFEKISVQNIMTEIKKEIDVSPTEIGDIIEKYRKVGYISHDNGMDAILETIETSLADMYLKKNRVFKSPYEMCNVLARIIGKATLF